MSSEDKIQVHFCEINADMFAPYAVLGYLQKDYIWFIYLQVIDQVEALNIKLENRKNNYCSIDFAMK